jgi:hypothetical protein
MWWNIFITVFGLIISFLVTTYTADCYFNYKKSSGNEKKAWKRAFQGWGILLFFVVLRVLIDFSHMLSSITN